MTDMKAAVKTLHGLTAPEFCKIAEGQERVFISQEYRKHYYGHQLAGITIARAQLLFPGKKVQLEAQDYARAFYGSFGFRAVSDVFLPDSIPHVSMLLENQG
ncbi:MAG: GNAT family N-acetyltransferase [Scardovia wiggsiae]